MTSEMVAVIVRLALRQLLELPEAELQRHELWLRHEHIQWCLGHVYELVTSKNEVEYMETLKQIADLYLKEHSR